MKYLKKLNKERQVKTIHACGIMQKIDNAVQKQAELGTCGYFKFLKLWKMLLIIWLGVGLFL